MQRQTLTAKEPVVNGQALKQNTSASRKLHISRTQSEQELSPICRANCALTQTREVDAELVLRIYVWTN
jgi:hypothetical protein